MASTSQRTFLGRVLTATHDLAGFASEVKYWEYTVLKATKSSMEEMKQVVLTTAEKSTSASTSTALRFSMTMRAWDSMPPSTTSPVEGSTGICPEVKRSPLAAIACE